jgi:hypothetical protein
MPRARKLHIEYENEESHPPKYSLHYCRHKQLIKSEYLARTNATLNTFLAHFMHLESFRLIRNDCRRVSLKGVVNLYAV